MDSMEEQVREVICGTFGLEPDMKGIAMGAVPGWDSMGHMELVVALENRFKVTFTTATIGGLVDVPSICNALQRAGGGTSR